MKQRTVKNKINFSGKGLQEGEHAEVFLIPQKADTGIIFSRSDIDPEAKITLSEALFSSSDSQRRTTLSITGGTSIQTVEHLMAALWAMGIDNVLIDVLGKELPALDGSAKGFLDIIKSAGIEEQPSERKVIKINEEIKAEEKDAVIEIVPYNGFKVSYSIDYDCSSIGKEQLTFVVDEHIFENEIAPARTFCLKKEAELLLKSGYGKGANYQNTLVMDEEGPIGTELRFKNEPIRHKILDLIGDLYLLGIRIEGEVKAKKSGHRLNGILLKKIYEKYASGLSIKR
ncbi:MAG: UDP-3-O-[3-hydroxymyristoyl] N-acetylglucosamine deacetylase [Candidatus Omnitrophica bacterium]|nr:UDP-3-O-[3-hydroxymyristoyl] N-acetylglucosamine deacetylase [Candidatus Omnitrophota bacterium]